MAFNLAAFMIEGLYDGMTRIELAATDRKIGTVRVRPVPGTGALFDVTVSAKEDPSAQREPELVLDPQPPQP